MYGIHIPEAALYYHETKHREVVTLDSSLRQLTYDLSAAMHKTFASGVTPKAEEQRGCKNCSVFDICVPNLSKKTRVSIYLKKTFDEETA
jgi:CRISPR-associated exonuclease Cas4